MAFRCDPIRQHNKKGQLIVAGAKWREGDRTAKDKMPGIIFRIIVAAGLVVFFLSISASSSAEMWKNGAKEVVTVSGILALAAILWCLLNIHAFLETKPRKSQLVFKINNSLQLDKLKPSKTFFPSNIVSIQYRRVELGKNPEFHPSFPRAHVFFLNDEGDISKAAVDLHEDQAVKVAAQLTKALTEIRAAMAVSATVQGSVLHVVTDADAFDPLAPK